MVRRAVRLPHDITLLYYMSLIGLVLGVRRIEPFEGRNLPQDDANPQFVKTFYHGLRIRPFAVGPEREILIVECFAAWFWGVVGVVPDIEGCLVAPGLDDQRGG